jgi:hypothetical protein
MKIIRGKLLSDDGRLAVAVLSLESSAVNGGTLDTVVNDIRQTAAEDLQGTGVTAELTGVPVMQLAIRPSTKTIASSGGPAATSISDRRRKKSPAIPHPSANRTAL